MSLFRKWKKAPPTDAEIERADRWLREAFRQESQRVLQQQPKDLHHRCLQAARAETESKSTRWNWQPELAWVSLIVIALAAAGLWFRQIETKKGLSPNSGAQSKQVVVAHPNELVRPGHSATNNGGPVGSSTVSLELAENNSGPTINRPVHSDASGHRRNAIVQHRSRRWARTNSSPAWTNEMGGDIVTYTTETGDVVTQWNLEPAKPGEPASVVAQLTTSAASGEPAQTFTVDATDVAPDKPYQVLVQANDTSEPVLIGETTSDNLGKLKLVASITPEISDAIRNSGPLSPSPATDSQPSTAGSAPSSVNPSGASAGQPSDSGSSSPSHPSSSGSSSSTAILFTNSMGQVTGMISGDSVGSVILRSDTGDLVFHSKHMTPQLSDSVPQNPVP